MLGRVIGHAETLASVEALALQRDCSVLGAGDQPRRGAGQRRPAGGRRCGRPSVGGPGRADAEPVRSEYSRGHGRPAGPYLGSSRPSEEYAMIVLGLILLVIGLLTKIAVLWTIGIIVLVVGLVLLVLGLTGRAVGGRKYWY
jgi:hypothetical protein